MTSSHLKDKTEASQICMLVKVQKVFFLKESGLIVNMPRCRVAKMVLDKIYMGGRHAEMILLILLKNKCLPESRVSNSRNSDATESLLVY